MIVAIAAEALGASSYRLRALDFSGSVSRRRGEGGRGALHKKIKIKKNKEDTGYIIDTSIFHAYIRMHLIVLPRIFIAFRHH
jgi:hypothetical protein